MKIRLSAVLLMTVILMITGCGNSNSADEQNGADNQIADKTDQTNTGENGAISAEEAENILRDYLISVNRWESNYVLEPLDPVLGKIENEEIFKFEIRYTDDTDEVGGRLIDNYVITTDGERIFWYNPADDEWVEQIGNGVVLSGGIYELLKKDLNMTDTGETSLINETETICEKTAVKLVEESENRIIVQRNVREMLMSLTVYLADGTSATIQYPMDTEKDYAYCETAYLQYDNQESIVLEIVNGTSNYGAAEYHVLHVEKDNDEYMIIEDATVLGEQPLTGDRHVYSLIGFVGNVSMTSAEDLITTIYGKPAVRFVDWDSGKKEGETYYLYYDREWKVSSAKLTIEKIIELSEKGEVLTWSDFEQYENSGDIGSGLYVIRYEMEEPYYVLVGGADTETFPMYIRLVSAQNPDNYIDIRTEDIEGFVYNNYISDAG